jgi:ubiquinol-cytochrome c reductase cytochrome c1 subunit
MRHTFIAALMLFVSATVLGAGAGVHLDKAHIDLSNEASLQRGARLFVNYCVSCHSASYMRYSRLAEDLGLTNAQVEENLMFTTDKVGLTIRSALSREDAEAWFGIQIPDLTVIGRVRGADWLYTYLRGFYLDESRPFGVNNTVFKDVGMPHVLADLQGWQRPVYEQSGEDDAAAHKVLKSLELEQPGGSMTPAEYDRAVRDLVAYLIYMGEPMKLERQSIGVWVLLFLFGFLALAYMLKREYWKDVH